MRGERAQSLLAVIFKQNTNRRGLVCRRVNQTCAGLELGTPRYFWGRIWPNPWTTIKNGQESKASAGIDSGKRVADLERQGTIRTQNRGRSRTVGLAESNLTSLANAGHFSDCSENFAVFRGAPSLSASKTVKMAREILI